MRACVCVHAWCVCACMCVYVVCVCVHARTRSVCVCVCATGCVVWCGVWVCVCAYLQVKLLSASQCCWQINTLLSLSQSTAGDTGTPKLNSMAKLWPLERSCFNGKCNNFAAHGKCCNFTVTEGELPQRSTRWVAGSLLTQCSQNRMEYQTVCQGHSPQNGTCSSPRT